MLAAVIAVCIFAFAGLGWIYLRLEGRSEKRTVSEAENKIPYSSVPQEADILYTFSNRTQALLSLNFAEGTVTAALEPAPDAFFDYELQPLSGAVEGFIDRLGGLEVEQGGKILRYTGSQAVKLLADGAVGEEELLRAAFDKIAQNGITRSQITFLLQNSRTDLTVPICYSWPEWLKELCANSSIINGKEEVF